MISTSSKETDSKQDLPAASQNAFIEADWILHHIMTEGQNPLVDEMINAM